MDSVNGDEGQAFGLDIKEGLKDMDACLKMNKQNQSKFELVYNQEGVFIRVFAGANDDDLEECRSYLKRKQVRFSSKDLETAFEPSNNSLIRIAEPCEEKFLNEEIVAHVSDQGMTASIVLIPGEQGGKRISREQIFEILKDQYKVVFGVNPGEIDRMLTEGIYNEPVVIATGKEPVRGADGELTYHFTIEEREKTYKVEDDGRINFKDRSKIESVKEGQVLVSRTMAGRGEQGMDVFGRPIATLKGKEIALPGGKNVVYSEDKLSIRAKINGHIEIISDKVFVSPAYVLQGDVDMKVGNIDFDGDVLITGNVHSDFAVKATGNITINGVVEAACIESGGDVILKKGIQGADKGSIRAKGSLYALFIHRTDVDVENKIVADIILHSKIKCEGEVNLTDKNGLLVGGNISVGNMLVARVIGAESGVATKIKLGISPHKRERFFQIGEELEQIKSGIERMDRALKSTVGQLTGLEIRMEVTKKMLSLKKEQGELEREQHELETQISEAKDGNVHVLNKIYPGVKISIGACIYDVKSEQVFVSFHVREGIISPEPCRYRTKP